MSVLSLIKAAQKTNRKCRKREKTTATKDYKSRTRCVKAYAWDYEIEKNIKNWIL